MFFSRPARASLLALLTFGVCDSRSPLSAQDRSKSADPVVALPKVVVSDSRELPPPESWRYAEIPGFEILTNASDASTQRVLRDFDLFRQALAMVFPMPDHAAGPTTLILCGKGGTFDAFLPTGKARSGEIASVFLSAHGRSAIVLDLETAVLDLPVNGDANAPTQVAVDHNKGLDREYVHFLLGHNEPRPPAWLEEGLAQIIMAMKFDRKSITFGQLEDASRVSAEQGLVALVNGPAQVPGVAAPADYSAEPAEFDPLAAAPAEDRDFNAALRERALLSFPKFFAVKHDSPEALNPLGNNLWAKQAYAFVHLCLYGEKGRYQKALGQFLARSSKEPVSEALFKGCFKESYAQMLVTLRGYSDAPVYTHQQFTLKGDGLTSSAPVLREATQAEIGRLKGETLGLAGHNDRAHAELFAAYQRGERDPLLLAALGLNERAGGDAAHARKFLEAATEAKVVRPEAYLELARIRSADALAQPAAANGLLSSAQTSAVLAPLLFARQQPPPNAEVYDLIAETWGQSATPPSHEDVAVLIEGVRRFPTRLRLIYQSAAVCARAGLAEPATVLSDYGLQVARDPAAKARFEALKAALPAH